MIEQLLKLLTASQCNQHWHSQCHPVATTGEVINRKGEFQPPKPQRADLPYALGVLPV